MIWPFAQRSHLAVWLLLVLFLVLAVPLFLCLPPFLDYDWYSVAVDVVDRGGLLERDSRWLPPPGWYWIRSTGDHLLGKHSVVGLRVVDLVVMFTAIGLLVSWFAPRVTRTGQAWMVLVLVTFYLGTPEVCHFQLDPWLFLPTIAGLCLRRTQMNRVLDATAPLGSLLLGSLGEGLLCGAACLIKPQAIIPMGALWLVTTPLLLRARMSSWKRVAVNLLLIAAGGSIAAAAWVGWQMSTGGWSYYLHNLQFWGGGYYSQAASWYMRLPALVFLWPPWSLLHLWAMPRAVWHIFRGATKSTDAAARDNAAFGAFFIAWSLQAAFVQVAWMPHLLPPAMMAVAMLMERLQRSPVTRSRGWLTGLVVAAMFVCNPMLCPHKWRHWPRCFSEGSTPALRDDIKNIPYYPPHITEWIDPARVIKNLGLGVELPQAQPYMYVCDYQDLDRVASFLRQRGVRDGEAVCYHNTTTSLYRELGILPPAETFWYDMDVHAWPQREPYMRERLDTAWKDRTRPRYIVSDLQRGTRSLPPPPDPAHPLALPDSFPPSWRDRFPWSEPIVFRAGRYAVHEYRSPAVPRLTGLVPDD